LAKNRQKKEKAERNKLYANKYRKRTTGRNFGSKNFNRSSGSNSSEE